MMSELETLPNLEKITKAQLTLKGIINHTPLMHNINLSHRYSANIYLKREDLQVVRSYKLRGAYNMINALNGQGNDLKIVAASAGNHAQGVAYSCKKLGLMGKIFMPIPTPKQKIRQVKMFGGANIEIILVGDTFDDAANEAHQYCKTNKATYIPPFDDHKIIEGQGTVGLEILQDAKVPIDYLFIPIGGGGLAAGVSTVFKKLSRPTIIVGVEPQGAAAMKLSIEKGAIVTLPEIDQFVDGAAVKRVGDLTFQICQDLVDQFITVHEGKICSNILQLYNEEAIVVEPAGALATASLDLFEKEIRGKNVVCIISGGNNDITRTEEIKERSLLYEGLKHFFIIRFPQRSGALKEFVTDVLGPDDDIVHFEYYKKNNREKGSALVGIELQNKEDFEVLIARMNDSCVRHEYLNNRPDLLEYLI